MARPGLKDEMRKRLTLDLTTANAKRARFDALLSSPDLKMLKLGSPELERLIMQQNTHNTETPTPSLYSGPKPPLLHPEAEPQPSSYARMRAERFEFSNTNSNCSTTSSFTGGSDTSDSETSGRNSKNNFYNVSVKEEPGVGSGASISSSPAPHSPLGPIDMENQERIKLERKRQRNRVAASKCRKRKLERIARLEEKVKIIKNENAELGSFAKRLRDEVAALKQEVQDHVNSGCQLGTPYFRMDNNGY